MHQIGSGVSEQARCLSLCLLLLGSCSRHLAVGCSSLGSLRGTCECKKHIFKQVDLSARLCRLGSSKNFSHVLSEFCPGSTDSDPAPSPPGGGRSLKHF
jgi:hypothetical protein